MMAGGGSVGPGGILLDAHGKPMLGKDGKPRYMSDARVPKGGRVGAGGIILDARGKPVLGADGKPMYAAYPPAATGGVDKKIASAEADVTRERIKELKKRQAAGQLSKEEQAELRKLEAKLVVLEEVIAGGLSDPAAMQIEAEETRARVKELKRRQAEGKLSEEELAELEKLEGRLAVLEEVMSGGLGDPAAAAEEELQVKGRLEELKKRKAAGQLTAEEENEMRMLEERVIVLEKVGRKALVSKEADEAKARIAELNAKAAAGELTEEEKKELGQLEAKLQLLEEVMAGGMSESDRHKEAVAAKRRIKELKKRKKYGQLSPEEEAELARLEGRLEGLRKAGWKAGPDDKGEGGDDGDSDEEEGASGGDEAGGKGKRKKSKNSEIVAAGRMLTLTRLRARDVPDMDTKGGDNNISDPYLIFNVLDGKDGGKVDEGRTPHIENARHPKWEETVRLFVPDAEAKSTKTANVELLITLMDKNKKKEDQLIGDVKVSLPVGSGKKRVEVPSRSVSSLRPFVFFRYDATPQMYFEQVEWNRVGAEAKESKGDSTDDEDDDKGVRKEDDEA